MKRLFNWAFHPFLFALYPPLYLFVHNIEELGLENILRTILASLLLAGLALALFRLAFKGWQKAALLATILVLAFYTYAPIFDRVNKLTVAGILIGRHRILVAVYALIFIFGVYLVLKKSVDFNLITNGLNLVSFVLVMFLLGQITMYLVKTTEANAPQNIVSIKDQLNPPAKSALPDIYYILIDTYARDDVILKDYHYDNSQFIADLKARGFYVPECSRSNFTRTELSISTALNLDYVQNFAANMLDVHATDAARMAVYVVNNKVKATLQSLGYKTIAFQTGYNRMDMTSADIFYALPKSRHNSQILYWLAYPGISSFEEIFLSTTPLWLVEDQILSKIDMKKVRADQDYADLVEAYELNQNNLKKLYSVPDIPGPKFVYDHLLTLHAPYVYDEEGEFHYYPRTDPKALVIGYTNSIMYTNKRLLPILDNILAKSHTPPVILIFGDHGLALDDDRIYNLAAYHLPQDGSQLLYPTITPVNSFRVIFDRYFGAKLPLLKDISYFSLDAPFKFTQVDEYLRKDCLN